MIHYLVARRHAYTMEHFFAGCGRALASRIRILLYEEMFSGRPVRLPQGVYIFTSLGSDMGARNPPAPLRRRATELHRALVQICGPRRVLNDPSRSLSRLEILQALAERGDNDFSAWRADGIPPPRYPVFLRAGHGTVWETPPLIRSADQYRSAMRAAAGAHERIAVEFLDTAGPGGVYRKYGCFVVGDRIVPRHLFFSRNWLVKQADLTAPGMLEEEFAFVEANPHAAHILDVCRLANITYGRVDYALANGRPQVWEINLTPALVTGPSADDPGRRPVHERFVEQFAAALDALEAA